MTVISGSFNKLFEGQIQIDFFLKKGLSKITVFIVERTTKNRQKTYTWLSQSEF